jgi:hypothetical protein
MFCEKMLDDGEIISGNDGFFYIELMESDL